MNFKLTNLQRKYLGIEPIDKHWDPVELVDKTEAETKYIIYFDKDVIKRLIISNEKRYAEYQFNEKTKNREILLPKTKRGKEKKLTPAVIGKRAAQAVYFHYYITPSGGNLLIGNYNNQRTILNSDLAALKLNTFQELEKWLNHFIKQADQNHFEKLDTLKKENKRRIKYMEGDIFSFRLDFKNYAFGRVIADLNNLCESNKIQGSQGINQIFGKPVMIEIYHLIDNNNTVDIDFLTSLQSTPQHYMQDNTIYYGEHRIIGNKKVLPDELDFPISFTGWSLQWGQIYVEKTLEEVKKEKGGLYNKVKSISENSKPKLIRPYDYTACPFTPAINIDVLRRCMESDSNLPYWSQDANYLKYDLRNPKNRNFREKVLKQYNLNPNWNYIKNLRQYKRKSLFDRWFRN